MRTVTFNHAFGIILVIVAIIFMTGCESCNSHNDKSNKEENADDEMKIGKYLYMSEGRVLHIRKQCSSILLFSEQEGHRGYGMKFIKFREFYDDGSFYYCTSCFDDEAYEQAQNMSKMNEPMEDSKIKIEW